MSEAGVRLRVIGDRTGFSSALNETIDAAEAATAAGSKMTLVIAANYGGRWDMLQAAQAAAAEGELTMEGVEKGFAPRSWAKWICSCARAVSAASPTSLLWQAAYAEFYFTDTLWPDFDGEAFDDALAWYVGRERRFGMTSEQLRKAG